MKTLFAKILLVSFVVLFSFTADAQTKRQTVPIQNLMQFLGRWKGDATLVLDGKTHKVVYSISARTAAGGMGLYVDETFTDSALGNLKGANVVGFNPHNAKIHWYSVDNMGNTHDHVGLWKTPDHLYIEYVATEEGKKYVEKIDFVFKSRKELEFTLVATLDGKEVKKGNAVFIKEVPTPMPGKGKPNSAPKPEATPVENK